MSKETQRKGDLAVAKAIVRFTEMGYIVSTPLSESVPYDLVIDTDKGLKRVQVKYFGGKTKPHFRMRRVHTNSTGPVVKVYTKDDFDWAYVYCSSGAEYLIESVPDVRATYDLRESELLK